jgi:membrane fusion protein, copper/silver efflux system
MKRIVIAGFLIVVAIIALYWWLRSPSGRVVEAQKTGSAFPASSPVEGEAGPGDQTEGPLAEIPVERQKMIGIRTVEAKPAALRKTIRTVGRVELDERKLTTVNIKVEGWVQKLYADYTGKYVKKGDPLADIYSPELLSTQLEYLNLLRWKKEQGHRFQRNIEFEWGDRYGTTGKMLTFDIDALLLVAKQKLALWEVSEEDVKDIEDTNEPMKTLTVRAPVSGYVFQKPALKGTRVSPGEKLFDIVDLSTVWVIADIYEYEIPYVKVGQQSRITLSYYPEKDFLSKVDFIYPSLSGQTRTAKARFVVPNPGMLLKPQMFASVEIGIDFGEKLAVPTTAVLDTGTRQVVYVDVGDGSFAPRKVKLGIRSDDMVEITSGVKPGEKVASSAVFLIDSEAKLKGVAQ